MEKETFDLKKREEKASRRTRKKLSICLRMCVNNKEANKEANKMFMRGRVTRMAYSPRLWLMAIGW